MKKLTMYPVTNIDELARPADSVEFSLFSPAVEFFTDFLNVVPLVLDASTTADEARQTMLKTHVRLMFVINEKNEFIGVITADDLAERKIVQQVAKGYQREDVQVTDLMTQRRELMALSIEDVNKSSIAAIVELLKDSQQQHCLVLDRDEHKIRGIFSASDISRKLKLPIEIPHQSDFYRVFSAIA